MGTQNPSQYEGEESKAEEHGWEEMGRVRGGAGGLFRRSCQLSAQERAPGSS